MNKMIFVALLASVLTSSAMAGSPAQSAMKNAGASQTCSQIMAQIDVVGTTMLETARRQHQATMRKVSLTADDSALHNNKLAILQDQAEALSRMHKAYRCEER